MNILNIMRASAVKRWHIVNTSKTQSVAEHTFNVVMMARDVCKRMGIDDAPAIKLALEHDLDEIIYGDIPSPGKLLMDMDTPYHGKHYNVDPMYFQIVKICDVIDAFLFIGEYNIDKHGRVVAEHMLLDINERMSDMKMINNSIYLAVSAMLACISNSEFEGLQRVRR